MGGNLPLISLPAVKTTQVAPNGEPNRAAGEREGGLQNLSLSITVRVERGEMKYRIRERKQSN